MHALLHYGIRLGFVAVIAVLFTLFVVFRPGGSGRVSKSKLIGLLLVGSLIAIVLIASDQVNAVIS